MKKIVFLLIAVLLLGTFVACDGEADFLLWEDEPAEKVLTLKIDEGAGGWSFEDNEKVLVKSFSDYDFSSVTTWQQLIDEVFEIVIYDDSDFYEPQTLKLAYYGWANCVGFEFADASLLLAVCESSDIESKVSLTDSIDFSVQYDLIRIY